MWTAAIIEVEITADRVPRLANAFVGPQIYLLVFDAAPQPLDEHVVPPCSFAIHTDRDAVAGERAGEGRAGELRALAGIEDFGLALTSEVGVWCADLGGVKKCTLGCSSVASGFPSGKPTGRSKR